MKAANPAAREIIHRIRALDGRNNVTGQVGLLQVAWSAAGRDARRLFLAEILAPACSQGPPASRFPAPHSGGGGKNGRPSQDWQADAFNKFLAQCVHHSAGDRVQSSVLHRLYEAWRRSRSEQSLSQRQIAQQMRGSGYRRLRSNVAWWLDIKLTMTVSDFGRGRDGS